MMRMKVTGVKGTDQLLKSEQRDVKLTKKQVKKLAKEGATYAKRIAPIDTGALINAIHWDFVGDTRAQIISDQPNHYKTPNRPYHLWMHGLGGRNTSNMIRSGDPKYMETTFKYIMKRIDEITKKD